MLAAESTHPFWVQDLCTSASPPASAGPWQPMGSPQGGGGTVPPSTAQLSLGTQMANRNMANPLPPNTFLSVCPHLGNGSFIHSFIQVSSVSPFPFLFWQSVSSRAGSHRWQNSGSRPSRHLPARWDCRAEQPPGPQCRVAGGSTQSIQASSPCSLGGPRPPICHPLSCSLWF